MLQISSLLQFIQETDFKLPGGDILWWNNNKPTYLWPLLTFFHDQIFTDRWAQLLKCGQLTRSACLPAGLVEQVLPFSCHFRWHMNTMQRICGETPHRAGFQDLWSHVERSFISYKWIFQLWRCARTCPLCLLSFHLESKRRETWNNHRKKYNQTPTLLLFPTLAHLYKGGWNDRSILFFFNMDQL